MSFTLTNQSLIRLESSKDDDEWNRTLMFFNVDISSGVCRDHQNKISQPRSSVCNGKRELINDIWQSSANPNIYANLGRAPGGGLANPITESVMSFVAANKFYAREHSNFDHGNYTPRTSGRRRDNFAYSDRRRHFYHRPIKSGRSRAAIGLVSPSPSADSTGYYESKRIHYPDFETGKTFDNFYPDDEPYELEEDEPRRVLSTLIIQNNRKIQELTKNTRMADMTTTPMVQGQQIDTTENLRDTIDIPSLSTQLKMITIETSDELFRVSYDLVPIG